MEHYFILVASRRALVILMVLAHVISTTTKQVSRSAACLLEEKRALLDFKASLNETRYAHLLLPSWTNINGSENDVDEEASSSDCCKWEGVECSNTTGRIVELQLGNLRYNIFASFHQYWYLNMTTFLPLMDLRALDLSLNSFKSEVEGCGQLANLKNLQSLNLDGNYFNSSIIPCVTAIPALKALSLHNTNLEGFFPVQEFNRLKQMEVLDVSLTFLQGPLFFKELKLEKLRILNLQSTHMDEFSAIEVMTSLKTLSLSFNRINDSSILQEICSLKNLSELDLSHNYFGGYVPSCFSNLTSLQFLDLSYNNFSGDIPAVVISRLIHLEYLSLSGNPFGGSFSFSSFANHSKLQILDLERLSNDLHVDTEGLALPPPFQLRVLYLPGCNLNKRIGRRIPSFLFNQKELRFLDLSSNKLTGEIPTWLIENNTQLEYLDLKNNSFMGSFLLDLDGSPKLNLSWLDISNNKVSGKIPVDIGLLFPNLSCLNLSRNSFEGNIPQSLGNLTAAMSIDLSHNKFFGEVPDRIENGCVSLELLVLSDNNLQGYFPYSSSTNLTRLQVLYLDNNYFNGSISNGISYSPNLYLLDISNNKLQGKIYSWIGNFSSLRIVDMSKNLLEGYLPDDICKLRMLEFLDLSENQLSGPLPSCSNFTSLRFIHLHKNQITGSPSSMFFKSFNLMSIDLRDNQLSGGISQNIGEHTELRVLLLGGNNLLGPIPLHLCKLKNLTIVDLSRNKFYGPLPSCLCNISFGRERFDKYAFYNPDVRFPVGGQLLTYTYNSLGSVGQSGTVYFRVSAKQEEVEFTTKSRTESYVGNILNFMSGLDLSCNQLTGEIPSEFGSLSGIRALNLSHNYLQGSIPSSLSMLSQVESLDLSYNNFDGEIPSGLANLNFLSIFNVSYNNLSGRTPDKGQFANFDEKNYKGNPGLCGPLLKRSCNPINNVPQLEKNVGDHGKKADGVIDKVAFTWSFFGSYMVTLLALAVVVCISPYYRRAWSYYIDIWILSKFCEYCRSRKW
ncbi:hypothetical protein ACH5RR_031695 [Cinchona calisaya]|uniref:Leucine-rich repeat-containing N-terminal plant-type domain-containing protein n=1 Tax=Cinchona calisaya TaxID=153742 RepID=A0ABD2YL83_9GENT